MQSRHHTIMSSSWGLLVGLMGLALTFYLFDLFLSGSAAQSIVNVRLRLRLEFPFPSSRSRIRLLRRYFKGYCCCCFLTQFKVFCCCCSCSFSMLFQWLLLLLLLPLLLLPLLLSYVTLMVNVVFLVLNCCDCSPRPTLFSMLLFSRLSLFSNTILGFKSLNTTISTYL